MSPALAATVTPGFADPVLEAQAVFRAVLDAVAEPGTVRAVAGLAAAPAPLSPVQAAVVATLADWETMVWRDPALSTPTIDAWLAFHTGAPSTADPARAAFALLADAATAPSWSSFALGSDIVPSGSTTVILVVAGFGSGRRFRLSGPGIAGTREIAIAGAPADLAPRAAANRALFPRGVDLVLCGPDAVVGLPRTTRIEEIA